MKNLILATTILLTSATAFASVDLHIGAGTGIVSDDHSHYSQVVSVKGGVSYNEIITLETQYSVGGNDTEIKEASIKFSVPPSKLSVAPYMTIGYAEVQTYQLEESGLIWGAGVQFEVDNDVTLDVGYKALSGYTHPESGMVSVGISFKL